MAHFIGIQITSKEKSGRLAHDIIPKTIEATIAAVAWKRALTERGENGLIPCHYQKLFTIGIFYATQHCVPFKITAILNLSLH